MRSDPLPSCLDPLPALTRPPFEPSHAWPARCNLHAGEVDSLIDSGTRVANYFGTRVRAMQLADDALTLTLSTADGLVLRWQRAPTHGWGAPEGPRLTAGALWETLVVSVEHATSYGSIAEGGANVPSGGGGAGGGAGGGDGGGGGGGGGGPSLARRINKANLALSALSSTFVEPVGYDQRAAIVRKAARETLSVEDAAALDAASRQSAAAAPSAAAAAATAVGPAVMLSVEAALSQLATKPWLESADGDRDLAVLFSGQGTQKVGMAAALLDHPTARCMFEIASEILGYSLAGLIEKGPQEKLDTTLYSQPAIFVCSLAAIEVTKSANPTMLRRSHDPESTIEPPNGAFARAPPALLMRPRLSFRSSPQLSPARALYPPCHRPPA